jgi:DNA-directed RNA polymerase subunit M/transcription elongation factor TFIIS
MASKNSKNSKKKKNTNKKNISQATIDKNIRDFSISKINQYVNDIDISTEIENEIYKYSINYAVCRSISPKLCNHLFMRIYKPKVYSIVSNLNTNSEYIKNKKLLQNLLSQDISPECLVNMKPYDLHPKRWKKYIKKQELLDKEVVDLSLQATTDQFKCAKCKSKKCTYVSVQIRSADEGMTSFITCVECSHSWRQN